MRSGKTLGVGGGIGVSGKFLGALTAGIVVLGCAGGANTGVNGSSGSGSFPSSASSNVTSTMSSAVTSSMVTTTTAINEMVVAVFDFSSSDSAGGSTMAGWSVVNDTVMGGVSSGQLAMEDGLMIFSGELSLDNKGGFASVRSPVIESQSTQSSSMSWADRIGPRIVVQGDGRTWTVEIRTDDESGGWIASLPTSPDSITDVTIPWSSFKPVTRFLDPRDAIEPLEPSRLVSIAFYLVDGIEGPFRLGIQLIS